MKMASLLSRFEKMKKDIIKKLNRNPSYLEYCVALAFLRVLIIVDVDDHRRRPQPWLMVPREVAAGT
jgi:hypothetical protein